jgi:hypothetical protein
MKSSFAIVLPVFLAAASAAALAAPVGYSVNSDAPDGDTLHRIDLATGEAVPVSNLQVLSATTGVRKDVEGLAFDRDGTLWAVDEDSFRLFQISTTSGIVRSQVDFPIVGVAQPSENDFGMTFTCDEGLFISSVTAQTLYRLDLNGRATIVGKEGALGYNISALAAWGSPTRLYGLGNGLIGSSDGSVSKDTRSLFSIDTTTGQATPISEIGGQAGDYYQAGLSFAADGTLWALIDRGTEPSQVLEIDVDTGQGTLVSTATGAGFESLAVAPPSGCSGARPPETMHPAIPALDHYGLLITLLALLGTGLGVLLRRSG